MNESGKALGHNLRRIRTERGLSLAGLAQRSGTAKATLANIENGRGNPTIDTVWSLAQALGVAFSDFFEPSADTRTVVVRADEGQHVKSHLEQPPLDLRLLDRIEGPVLTEVYDMVLTGGGKQDGHGHGDGVVERILLHTGRMLAGPADEPVELGPGDFIRYPADSPHVYVSLDDSRCQGMLLVEFPRPTRRA